MEKFSYNGVEFLPSFPTGELNRNKMHVIRKAEIEEMDIERKQLKLQDSNIFAKKLYSMHEIECYKKLEGHDISPKMIGYCELQGEGILVLEKLKPMRSCGSYVTNNKNEVIQSLIAKVLRMHELGIVHRDIKMDNLLINKENDVLICDFEDKGYSDEWAAPEVLEEYNFSKASDIYSLGCTIFEIVNDGSNPWGDDDRELDVLAKELEFITESVSNPVHRSIIQDCLTKRCVPENYADLLARANIGTR